MTDLKRDQALNDWAWVQSGRLQGRCLALLVAAGLVGCGGEAMGDLGTGGTGGVGGSAGSGASGGQGGSTQGGSTQGGQAGTAQGGQAGTAQGGQAGTAQGGQAGTAQGGQAGTAQGGQGGSSFGGAAGAGGTPAFSVEGEVVCDFCGTWVTCWDPSVVPGGDGATLDENGCPDWLDTTRTPNFCQDNWIDYWPDAAPFNGSCCYQSMYACGGGRPFVVSDEARVAPVVPRGDWIGEGEPCAAGVPLGVAARLVQHWIDDAQMEHASVAAFARLTLELMAFGAPSDLVRDSQIAGLDEQRHAELCFRMASRFAGVKLGPGPLSLDGALSKRGLTDFAWCTFVEGCLGESMAALIAEAGAELAQDGETKQVLSGIAADESRHAELAWRVVAWVLAELEPEARSVLLHRMQDETRLQLRRLEDSANGVQLGTSTEDLAAYGRVSPTQQLGLRRAALERAVLPCIAALLGENQLRAA
ncbi:MAG: ferritin-like domain-containing protein [Polyangiaceae bacterium]|nr:ferritin-like domain-containing protein [Myxococcales bacterium]MCB9589740.1 ferritin-like domain-containing protein [Polyangiaceae bacterium]